MKRDFEKWFSTFTDTIANYEYFVDFNKVYNNTEIPYINKKEINYKKNSINNISSKMLYQNSFKIILICIELE